MRTAEYVSPMHPDKRCDILAGKMLDELVRKDDKMRAAIEIVAGNGVIHVVGEVTTKTKSPQDLLLKVAKANYPEYAIDITLDKQSTEIAGGIEGDKAGDQGGAIGYWKSGSETPHEHALARSLCKYVFKKHQADGKTQITLDKMGLITEIVCSFANIEKHALLALVIGWYNTNGYPHGRKPPEMLINPAGDWEQSGFDADTGCVNRKLVVDAFGWQVPISGGGYHGKDFTKMDASAPLFATKIAKHYTQKLGIQGALVKLSFAIGHHQTVDATIEFEEDGCLHEALEIKPILTKDIIAYAKVNYSYEELARFGVRAK
jgi:S-adenosylmethionine synthetase